MSSLLGTISLILMQIINLIHAADFVKSQTSLPLDLYWCTTAILDDTLILINGPSLYDVNLTEHSINISLILDSNDNTKSWDLLMTQKNINHGQDSIWYYGQDTVQLNDTVYGVPRWESNYLFQFSISSKQYKDISKYNYTLPTPAAFACLVASKTKKIFVIGGINNESVLDTMQMYDITEDIWIYLTPMDIAATQGGCAMTDDEQYIYFFGGFTPAVPSCTLIQRYNR